MKTRKKPEGGFQFIGAHELLGVYFAFTASLVRWYDLRVWFACQEAVARRCGARKGIPMRYSAAEIHALVGGAGGEHVRAAIRRLEAAGLLCWSESAITFGNSSEEIRSEDLSGLWMMVEDLGQPNRKVPVPRRTIRFIAAAARKVLTATMLGHLLRCCYFRRGGYASEGSCSAAWVARVFGLDERNVKIARKNLVAVGWLMPLTADAWHRQRYGARWAVNPAWSQSERSRQSAVPSDGGAPIVSPERSPRNEISAGQRSPLLSLKENSSGSKNQKPALPAVRPAGSCRRKEVSRKAPTLKHVVVEDLRDTARTLRLFEAAVGQGFVSRSEADLLKVVAAAERALRVASANTCGLFVTLVRRKLWHHITLDEEDAARRRLKEVADCGELGSTGRERQDDVVEKDDVQRVSFGSSLTRNAGDDGVERAEIRALIELSLASSRVAFESGLHSECTGSGGLEIG